LLDPFLYQFVTDRRGVPLAEIQAVRGLGIDQLPQGEEAQRLAEEAAARLLASQPRISLDNLRTANKAGIAALANARGLAPEGAALHPADTRHDLSLSASIATATATTHFQESSTFAHQNSRKLGQRVLTSLSEVGDAVTEQALIQAQNGLVALAALQKNCQKAGWDDVQQTIGNLVQLHTAARVALQNEVTSAFLQQKTETVSFPTTSTATAQAVQQRAAVSITAVGGVSLRTKTKVPDKLRSRDKRKPAKKPVTRTDPKRGKTELAKQPTEKARAKKRVPKTAASEEGGESSDEATSLFGSGRQKNSADRSTEHKRSSVKKHKGSRKDEAEQRKRKDKDGKRR